MSRLLIDVEWDTVDRSARWRVAHLVREVHARIHQPPRPYGIPELRRVIDELLEAWEEYEEGLDEWSDAPTVESNTIR